MRHDHMRPFDVEADEAAETTAQFWGTTRAWAPDAPDPGDGDMWAERTGSLRAIRGNLTANFRRRQPGARQTGAIERTRAHGIVRPNPELRSVPQAPVVVERREATLGELAAGWPHDEWAAASPTQVDVEIELEHDRAPSLRRRSKIGALSERLGAGAVDPLLARLGAIVMIGVSLVPVALASRGGGDAPLLTATAAALAPAGLPNAGAPATVVATLATETTATEPAAAVDPATTGPTTDQTIVPTSAQTTDAVSVDAAAAEAAVVTQPAQRVEPACALVYAAVPGDSWYRIADGAGITPRALLDANLAQLDTPIFPGDEICLPPGASMPPPPATTSVATTASPPTTGAAPATTVPPTTSTAPLPPIVSPAEVQQLIRDIWPDELEQRALEIAWRESSYRADAYNGWCCYGVFQIYYTAHSSWLDELGVQRATDLFDARKNITAAYEIYRRAGGWGPWGG